MGMARSQEMLVSALGLEPRPAALLTPSIVTRLAESDWTCGAFGALLCVSPGRL